ncbi:MAG: DUF1992 domain-containing protein [Nitrospirae bacterium]|nr:DUF1992 domain-containing protein [Nitrospirota bacterium]
MEFLAKIAERKIIEAIENGEFDNLEGRGKPIIFEDDTWIPEDLRMAYRFLKNAGCTPPELELRKEIMNLCSLMNNIDDDKERLKKFRELNFMILKLNLTRKKPFDLEDFPEYEAKIMDKMLKEKNPR